MFIVVLLLSGIIVNVFLAVLVMRSKHYVRFWYILHAIGAILWSLSMASFLVLIDRQNMLYPMINDFLIRLSYSAFFLYILISAFFISDFPYIHKKQLKIETILIMIGYVALVIATLSGSTIIQGVNVFFDGRVEIVFGNWITLGAISLVAYIILFTGNSYRRMLDKQGQKKIEEYSKILIAYTVSALGGIVFMIVVPMYSPGSIVVFLGPLLSQIIFVQGVLEVNRFEKFDWKVMISELALAIMGIILIVLIINNNTWYGFMSDIIILIVYLILSSLLVNDYLSLIQSKKVLHSKNTQLQEIALTKDNFLRMTSHQLRTPLAGLHGFVRMILDNEDNDLHYSGEFRDEMIKVLLNTQRLNTIVDDLSIANAISSNRFEISHRVQINMKEFVEHLLAEQEHFFANHNTQVHLEEYGKNWLCYVDPITMREAIVSVISNAVYLGGGDVRIVFTENEKLFEMDVYDNGIGLTEDDLSLIGQRFRRGRRAIQHHPDGLGLGIFITNVILQKHGGAVHFISDGVGKGTRVHVVIPKSI